MKANERNGRIHTERSEAWPPQPTAPLPAHEKHYLELKKHLLVYKIQVMLLKFQVVLLSSSHAAGTKDYPFSIHHYRSNHCDEMKLIPGYCCPHTLHQ